MRYGYILRNGEGKFLASASWTNSLQSSTLLESLPTDESWHSPPTHFAAAQISCGVIVITDQWQIWGVDCDA